MLNNQNYPIELQNLVEHLTDKDWQEKFLQTVEALNPADSLLLLMQEKFDELVTKERKLKELIVWINEKSSKIKGNYKPSTVRAFYLALVRVVYLDFASAFDDPSRGRTPARNFATRFARSRQMIDNNTFDPTQQISFGFDPAGIIAAILTLNFEPALTQAIQELERQMPDANQEREKFDEWRKAKGKDWVIKLERLIGCDLRFNEQEKETLKKYYYAHNLIANCLKKVAVVTPEVRQRIEDGLLLTNVRD